MIEGYVDNEAMHAKPWYNPNETGVALVDAGDRQQRDGRNEVGQDTTGIRNKACKSGCNHCRDKKHWMDNCLHRHVTDTALGALPKKNTVVSQLLLTCRRGERQRK